MLLLIQLFLLCEVLAAPRPLSIRRIGPEQGLSQVTARTIAQDAAGLVWIGTESGLNLYDGVRITYLRHDPEDPGSLSDNYVRALLAASDGGMWVGTLGGGLNRFVPATGAFVRYPAGQLPSEDVETLFGAADGSVWIGHGAGVSRLDPITGGFSHIVTANDEPLGKVLAISQSRDGDIWLGTARNGLYRLAAGKDGAHGGKARWAALSPGDVVLALHTSRDGGLWVGTENSGLYRLEPADERLRPVEGEYDREVTAIAEDDQGAIWFATWSGGVNRIDPLDGRIETYRNRGGLPGSLSSNTVISLMRDHSGVLWAGTFDAGVNLVMPYDGAFEHHAYDPVRPDGLIHSMVWSFAESPSGDIWVGTRRGLSRFDRASGNATAYLAQGRCTDLGIGVDVRALLPEGEQLWLGLADGGLVLLDPENCGRRSYREQLSSARVRLLLRDAAGELWIGTDNGLNRLDPVSGWMRHYRADGREGSLPHNRIRSLYEDADGVLWVGSSGGLSRFDAATDRFITFTRADGLLSDDDVRGIYRDEEGILWLATGIGLTRLDPETRRARFFYEKHGLSNNTLYSVIPDGPHLWITTNGGLTRFDRHSHAVMRFDHGDGLQSNEFNFNAHLKLSGGELLLGGIAGFNLMYPSRLMRDVPPPKLQLAYVSGNGGERRYVAGAAGSAAFTELAGGSVSFEPRVLHYLNSGRNGYRYRLLGYDQDWTTASVVQASVTYSDLPPGEYRFQVVGFAANEVESGPPLELAFRVPRPVWMQPWVLLAALLAFVGLAWLLATLRTRALRARATSLQADVDRKTGEISAQNERLNRQADELQRLLANQADFYRRVAHELKTPLTLITLPLSRLQTLAESRHDARDALATVARGVERLDQLVDQLTEVALDRRETGAERQTFGLRAFLEPLVGLYAQAAMDAGIRLQLAPLADVAVTVHRAVFEDVLHNLLGNALKYTPVSGELRVQVELLPEQGMLRLGVSDSGPGLSAGERERIFERGYRTAHAMARDPGGHGLGLHISRSRLRAVGGEIVVCSEPGKGCLFIADLPCTWSGTASANPADQPQQLEQEGSAAAHEEVDLLFVEDDPDLRIALAAAFAGHYRLRLAASMGEGLALAREHLPELVVCDRMLPDGDGLGLIEQLKQHPDTCHIPVVVLTALAGPGSQQEGWRSLADDYVAKPFQPEILRLRIDSHIRNRRLIRNWARSNLLEPGGASRTTSTDGGVADERSAVDARYVARLEEAVFGRLTRGECQLETIAADLSQSARTLQRKLQALYGCGFSEYVADLQLRKVKESLDRGMSVKQAALEAGFSTQSYMGRVFRRRVGMTPSEYRMTRVRASTH